jgi:hypothetical protein
LKKKNGSNLAGGLCSPTKTPDLFSEVDLELLQKLMHFDVLDMHL